MSLSRAKRHVVKALGTLGMCYCMFMARTFGCYRATYHVDLFMWVRYEWRGKDWAIPITYIEEVDQCH